MSYKQVIVLRVDLGMSKGKLVAQGAHASLEAALKAKKHDEIMHDNSFNQWVREGMKKVVLKVESEAALLRLRDLCVRAGIKNALIKDAGLTEIPAGSITAFGIGPDEESKINKITKDLNAL